MLWTVEEEELLSNMAYEGLEDKKIANTLGKSKAAIQSKRYRNNIKIRKFNENVFKQLNNKSSWLLGLITSDGSFNKSRPKEVTFYNTDFKLINEYKKVFEAKKKIYNTGGGEYGENDVYRITLSSLELINDLKKLNAFGVKDKRNPFPLVPDIFKWAFIKGLYDGDGNFYKGTTSIAGKKDIIKFVYYWICQQIDKKPNKIYQSSNSCKTFYFQISKRDSKLVWNELLKDCAVVYDSKKVKKVIDYFRD